MNVETRDCHFYIEDIMKVGILFKSIISDDIKKKLLPYGIWKTMTPDVVWEEIIVEFCVRGGAKPIDDLRNKEEEYETFLDKMSREAIMANEIEEREEYVADILRENYATRFHNKAVKPIIKCLENQDIFRDGRLVLFDGIEEGMDEDEMRDILLKRIRVFGMKSVSDFMIEIGMARNLIAFDTRVVDFLCEHFGLTVKRKDGKGDIKNVKEKIQADEVLYKALENRLREDCQEIGIELSLLDRLIFKYGTDKIVEDLISLT